MEESADPFDALIRSGARRLTGFQRRAFQAEVAVELCSGNARLAERRFGWGRETVEKGLHERRTGLRCLEDFVARGKRRVEDLNPRLAADIRAIASRTPTPTRRSSRRVATPTSRPPRSAPP
jgi:hypothetical protein